MVSPEVAQAAAAFVSGAFDDEKASLVDVDLPQAVASALSAASPSTTLLHLIRHLGSELTSDDEVHRSRAVVLLSLAVSYTVEKRYIEKQATTTLAQFFSSKLEDGNVVAANIAQSSNAKTRLIPGSAPHHWRPSYPPGSEMLVSSLKALHSLSKLSEGGQFGSEAARSTAEGVLTYSDPRSHPQAIRFLIFQLMDQLISRYRSALKALGKEFVKGYIDLVEGEKDPRNLVYIFAMDRVVLIDWDEHLDKELTESMFDVTYCYFPITFRPPPDDPYGISTNTLRLALRKVLTASPVLASHAMPLLLEKLQASGGNAKRDTLETLEKALPVFGRAAAVAHQSALWEAFKIEIMHATDEATAICSSRALEALLKVLYIDVDPPEGLAPRMIADMLDELEHPSKSLAKPAANVMATMIHASPSTAYLATYAVLDQLLTAYKDPDKVSTRGPILEHVVTILKAIRAAYQDFPSSKLSAAEEASKREESRFTFAKPASSEVAGFASIIDAEEGIAITDDESPRSYEGDKRPLDPFRDLLIGTLSHGLKTFSSRFPAVEAFVALTHIPGSLTPAETKHLCDSINELLIDADADDVRAQALEALRDLGSRRVIEESTLPLLFGILPDSLGSNVDHATKGAIRRSFGALAKLCTSPDLFDLLVVRLNTKLDLVCSTKYDDVDRREANVGYARGILNTLLIVLEEKLAKGHRDVARYPGVVINVTGLCVSASIRSSSNDTALTAPIAADPRVLRDAGALITLLTRCLDDGPQRDLASTLFSIVIREDLASLAKGSSTLARLGTLEMFSMLSTSPTSRTHRNVLHTFASAIVALRRPVGPPRDDVSSWLTTLLDWTAKSQTSLQEEAGSALLQDCVNKHVAEPLSKDVVELLDSFWSNHIQASSIEERFRAVRIWLRIAKSFVIRAGKAGEEMIEKALKLLEADDQVARVTARKIGEIGQDDAVLCRENGSVVRLLYKQRFFTFMLPRIMNAYRKSRLYLVTLASLLPSMPRQTTRDRLVELFPLIILCLDLSDPKAQASAVATVALAAVVGKSERDKGEGRDDNSRARLGDPLDLVESHLSSIFDRLLRAVEPDLNSPMEPEANKNGAEVRVAALKCLGTLARTVPYERLHPHRNIVLKALIKKGQGVDDPLRKVRVAAVDCRDTWFTMKEEGTQ